MNQDELYQLSLRKKELIGLCRQWQVSVRAIPSDDSNQMTWGPTPEDLLMDPEIQVVGLDANARLSPHMNNEDQESEIASEADSFIAGSTSGDLMEEDEYVDYNDSDNSDDGFW